MYVEMMNGGGGGGSISTLEAECTSGSSFNTVAGKKYILCADLRTRTQTPSGLSSFISNATDFEILGYAAVGSSSGAYAIRFKATSSSITISSPVSSSSNPHKLIKEG